MGVSALPSHSPGKKHKEKVTKSSKGSGIAMLFKSNSESTSLR